MPRMNHIYLLGYLKEAPKIKPDKVTGLPMGMLMTLTVVRGNRSVGDHKSDIGHDDVTVIAELPELAQKLAGAMVGDVVSIEGVFQQRRNMDIPHHCSECGKKNVEKGDILCIYALYGAIVNPCHDVQKALDFVISVRHTSNVAYVSGFLTNDPREYSSAKDNLLITQYPLIMNRQVTIVSDPPDLKTDEIVVKSFSERARRDKDALHRGSRVMVLGYLHTRSRPKRSNCQCCEKPHTWYKRTMEILSVETDYLSDFYSDEEIAAREAERQAQMLRDASHVNANDVPRKRPDAGAPDSLSPNLQTAGDIAGTASLFSGSIWKEDKEDARRKYTDPNDPLFEFEDGDDLDDL